MLACLNGRGHPFNATIHLFLRVSTKSNLLPMTRSANSMPLLLRSCIASTDNFSNASKHIIRSFTTSEEQQQQQQQQRQDTTTAAAAAAAVPSLRKLISPFLLMCHPDKVPSVYEEAKRVNLNAVQTLNSFIDGIQSINNALINYNNNNSTIKENNKLETDIEFMVPSTIIGGAGKAKHHVAISTERNDDIKDILNDGNTKIIYTRRSVSLSIPSTLLSDIQHLLLSSQQQQHHHHHQDNNNKERNQQLSSNLMKCAMHQIGKLLKAAELKVPLLHPTFYSDINDEHNKEEEEAPLFTIDWEEKKKRYDQAIKRYEADIATLGISDQERKRRVVSNIVGKLRFYPENVGVLDQLVTLRRLSLLLVDEFDTLQIEDHGKLWENLTLVVVASDNDSSAIIVPAAADDNYNYNAGTSSSKKKKKKKRTMESGFKFSLRGDFHLVVSIPLSFGEQQFVNEFVRHLPHFDMEDEIY